MIENNYFYFLENINKINFIEYILFYSIITIQTPINLFIYHNINLCGKYFDYLKNNELWKKYKTNIKFIYIDKSNENSNEINNENSNEINNENSKNNNFQNKLVEDINNYGGIYIKNKIFIIKEFNTFLIHDYIQLNNILYGIKKSSNIDNFNDIYKINKRDNYFNLNDNLFYNLKDKNIYIQSINDYNFNLYFDIIYNNYIIDIDIDIDIDSKDIDIIYNNLIDNKITIFNLILYYVLGYNYYFEKKIIEESKFKLINYIDKIYYINLESSNIRNNNMIKILNEYNISYERYEGLDGKKYNNIKNNYYENKYIVNDNSNSEYAVLYSHLSLIDKLQYEEGEYFLIFEDDLCLDFNQYWDKSIQEIINNAPKDHEIIMIGYFTLNLNFTNCPNVNYRLWNNDWSALSYIIKKSSIHKINKYKNKNNKYKLFDDINVADNYIFRLFKTYVYKYPLFTINNNNKSTFHRDHENYQKIYKNINLLILNNTMDKYIYSNIP